jgi:hypothetical protein
MQHLNGIPVRFFVCDFSAELSEEDENDPFFDPTLEVNEAEFMCHADKANAVLSDERHIVLENGVSQICFTVTIK